MRGKIVFKAIAYPTIALVGLGALLAIAALTPRKWSFVAEQNCEFTIYLASDGFHTNFFVPVQTPAFNWGNRLNLAEIANQSKLNYRYLQFGWGDRIFYVETPSWDQVKFSNALRALFYWRNQSALFVKGHSTLPHLPNEEIKCLRLNKRDYLALMNFIDNSFQTDHQGQKQRIASGQDQQSSFYAATGYYSVLNTCNSWTANGLRAANVNTPLWAGLAQPVMFHLRNGCECEEGKRGNGESGADEEIARSLGLQNRLFY